ncbi:DUF397 domain-containing protein [Nocardia flavorosea]|uniref:DUF397 domain-containing protein n=1 Tax=Nocardia flavorosea TaxID=53429 RepID=UPI0024581A9F|nr:DUF397 domain-containing protein [Nocardia flavorosea]
MSVDRSEARWFKSSYSGGSQDCVEVAFIEGDSVGVRDSKARSGPALSFTPAAWEAFTSNTRSGQFDRL